MIRVAKTKLFGVPTWAVVGGSYNTNCASTVASVNAYLVALNEELG